LKVLHIITGLNNGGGQAVLYRLTTADRENTHQIISLMDSGLYGDHLNAMGIPVYSLNMSRGLVFFKGLLKLYRLIRSINPDVVQTWMYHADLAGGVVARLAGQRAVVWGIRNCNLDPEKTSCSTRWTAQLCARFSRLVPCKIVSCSEQAVGFHADLGFDQSKVVVISNGYDLTRLTLDPATRFRLRAEWGIDSNTVLLGMIARWDPLKDHANLFAALARFQAQSAMHWRCVLVGSDMTDSNAQLVNLLEQYGVRHRVQLLGLRSDVPAVMNALDLHVLSSVGEAFPNVVAEAMACGTPCGDKCGRCGIDRGKHGLGCAAQRSDSVRRCSCGGD
jgi:glycosyltransferase involved in cell wall biosynthesis